MFVCRKNENWPNFHTHQKADEGRRCWAGQGTPVRVPTAPLPASPPAPVVPLPPASVNQPGMVTPNQLDFIEKLDGDVKYAYKLTKSDASDYIKKLLADENKRSKPVEDPRLNMAKAMIEMIPDGYYATQADEGGHTDFLRVKRPESGKYKGALKIQTQHSEQWRLDLIKWPSGMWQLHRPSVIDPIMLVVANWHECSMRYSIELQKCRVCNKDLTDDRSRHYLIGPICDQKSAWQWVIEEVDRLCGDMSYEQLVARGLPIRAWQTNHNSVA